MGIVLFAIISVSLFTMAIASASLAPWVPTRKKDLERILKLAGMKKNETFCDLGCGDGRVAAFVAKNSQAVSVGIELSFIFFAVSLARKYLSGIKRLKIKFKNIYSENLAKVDAVFIFPAGRKKLSGKLKNKLEKEAKRGTRVITYAFPVDGWKPDEISKPEKNDITIYKYVL